MALLMTTFLAIAGTAVGGTLLVKIPKRIVEYQEAYKIDPVHLLKSEKESALVYAAQIKIELKKIGAKR